MEERLVNKLLENGWNPSKKFQDVDHWRFFVIRNFNILRVVCVVEKGHSSKDEVVRIKEYLSQRMPWISLRGLGLTVVFLETPFIDLSECLSKYSRKITIQKIIQVTQNKVYEQNTWITGIIDRLLGGLVSEMAGSREIIKSQIDGGIVEGAWKKNWILYAVLIMAVLELIRVLLR